MLLLSLMKTIYWRNFRFNESGGKTIHFKSVDDALAKLKEYGFGNTVRTNHL